MKLLWITMGIISALVFGVGCSTTGNFKIPAGSKLMVTDRTAQPDAKGDWKTSPFFWTETGGAKYRLIDANGNTVRTGKLKTHFRPASIFWPPMALIYWPMGFENEGTFDLTRPGDGVMVTDESTTVGSTSVNPAHETAKDEPKAPATKKKSKK